MNSVIKSAIPLPARVWLRDQQRRFSLTPPYGFVRFGSLRRLDPICDQFGFSRGQPIDRYYIEKFLAENGKYIRGRVLEVAEDVYTVKFGGHRVTRSDVLHPTDDNPDANIIADLTCADHIPANTYDCMILTQTLPFIYDVRAALRTIYRILKPGGTLLSTNPSIDRMDVESMERWGQFWRFTDLSIRKLLAEVFGSGNLVVKTYGNALAATAFLHGVAAEELSQHELDHCDPCFQVSIGARVSKDFESAVGRPITVGTVNPEAKQLLDQLPQSSLVNFITQQYGVEVIEPLRLMPGGIESRVWVVKTNKGDWVLKIFGAHQGPIERIRDEAKLYEHLNNKGLRAPHVMPTLKGDKVAELSANGITFGCHLMRFETLRQCHAGNVSELELLCIARTQAKMHMILREYSKDAQFAKVPPYRPTNRAYVKLLDSPFAAALNKEELSTITVVDRKMVDYAKGFKQVGNLTASTLHGDMRLEHAQFLPSGEVYLFDFADRSWGLVAHGLAVTLAHFYCDEEISFERWEQLRDWLLKGYTSICALTDDDIAAIKPLLVMRLLDEITYLSIRAKVLEEGVDPEVIKKRYRLADYLLTDHPDPRNRAKKIATSPSQKLSSFVKNIIPSNFRVWLRKEQRRFSMRPPLGWVRFGSLRRPEPLDRELGFSRGEPIDRYYMQHFFNEHKSDIKGRVLEIGDNSYTCKFGSEVNESWILNVEPTGSENEIVADLQAADHLPSDSYDCVICLQTFPCIFDLEAAVHTLHRILKPGGVLLASNPGCAPIHEQTMRKWGQYWRFTRFSVRALLETKFKPENILIKSFGNVFAATAFAQGVAAGELKKRELGFYDSNYEVLIASRVVKS